MLGLIGESGAGKSTIGLAAMGFTRDGTRISGGSGRVRRHRPRARPAGTKRGLRGPRIAYVAQSAAATFNPAHKLIDQTPRRRSSTACLRAARPRTTAIELYRRLRLPNPEEIGFRYPHQVSGGQLQRAMTAMAMGCRPDLIIFDEPTTALDVTTQIEVLAAIRDIVAQFDTAAIYITHDLAVVAQMADRIKVLLKGEEVEEADTRTMLTEPREDYTKSLWAVRSFQRPQKPLAGRGETPVIRVEQHHRRLWPGAGAARRQLRRPQGADRRGRRRVRARASRRRRASSPACCRRPGGASCANGQPLRADYRRRSKDQLRQAQMIYQMADTALNPKRRIATSSAGRCSSISA